MSCENAVLHKHLLKDQRVTCLRSEEKKRQAHNNNWKPFALLLSLFTKNKHSMEIFIQKNNRQKIGRTCPPSDPQSPYERFFTVLG